MVLAALRVAAAPPEAGAAQFTLLDVGQGLAAVVETRRHVLVYDTGPAFRSGTDTGALVVEPYLRSRGLRQVDVLVASHDDGDHAGGAESLARLMPVRRLVASGHALDQLGRVEPCRAGTRWAWDGVGFEWLHPGAACCRGTMTGPACCACARERARCCSPATSRRTRKRRSLERGAAGGAEVVVVPHHGSRTSSGPALVEATRPRWALVSAGSSQSLGFSGAERGGALVARRCANCSTPPPRAPSSSTCSRTRRRPRRSNGGGTHRRPWQDP